MALPSGSRCGGMLRIATPPPPPPYPRVLLSHASNISAAIAFPAHNAGDDEHIDGRVRLATSNHI